MDVLLLNPIAIAEAHASFDAGEGAWTPAIKRLLRDAGAAMNAEPVSVVQKQQTPPSGDRHDYMSVAPYWWPDTTKPDGVPYTRRDGETNPEYHLFGDHERLRALIGQVQTLALAFVVTGEERYAEKAILQIKIWFLDPQTRMNPNLHYAQAIRGITEGRGIGIIETYGFRDLIDALVLLKASKRWTTEVDGGIRQWFEEYLRWLQESSNGKDEAGWKNNHGSAYDVQVTCIAFFLGKADVAKQILGQVAKKRIAVQVEPDGSQPLELERTKSWNYANMNLDALVELARLGERLGIDLWRYQTSDGRCLRKAVDYLLPFALGNKKWTWKQIVPFEGERMYGTLRIVAEKYDDMSYLFAAQSLINDQVRASKTMFYLPPLPVE